MPDIPKIDFSVVLPVYNGEAYVGTAIRSVLAQDYPAREIIVVDDGSTDATPDVCRSFGDKILYERIPNSGGPARPRNIGIQKSRGEYIAFLDADDFWFRHKLSVLADSASRFPGVGLFASDYVTRRDGPASPLIRHSVLLRHLKRLTGRPLGEDALRWLIFENFIGTPSAVAVKRSVISLAGYFDEDFPAVEDLEFYLRAALFCDSLIIEKTLLYKRDHSSNLSGDKVKLYAAHRCALEWFFKVHSEKLEQRKLVRRYQAALANLDYLTGNSRFEAGQAAEAFRDYRRALKTFPSASNAIRFLWVCSKKALRSYRENSAR